MYPQGSRLRWSIPIRSKRTRHLILWKGFVCQLTFQGGRWGLGQEWVI